MKRTLSLLLALVMVVTMIPAVFAETEAEKPGVGMDEMITLGEELNPEPAVVGTPYETKLDTHYYNLAVETDGNLQLTDGAVIEGVEAVDGLYAVKAGETYTVVVTGAGTTWSAAYYEEPACEHTTLTYTDNLDGSTHKVACSECGEVVADSEAHTDTDNDNVCDSCEAALEPVVPTDPALTLYRSDATKPYASMMLGNEIKISVNLKKTNYSYDDYYVEFSINNNGNIVTTTALPTSSSNATYANFQYAVPAPLMTETITAIAHGVKDGVTYSGAPVTLTVRESLFVKLDSIYHLYNTNEMAQKQFDLFLHMLEYGAQAQIQFKLNTDDLATDGLKDEYRALLKTEVPAYNTAPSASGTVYMSSMGLMLKEKINMYCNFKFGSTVTTIEDYSVEVVHTKSDGDTDSYTITSGDGGLKPSGKYVVLYFEEIAPSQLRDQLEITLYKNGEAITETYVRTTDMATASLTEALRSAILNYADCAKTYFG